MRTKNTLTVCSAGLLLTATAVNASPAGLWRDIVGDLVPHLTPWQQEAGTWTTTGEEPPAGWYLRGKRQYDLHSLELSIRKESDEGLVYL